MNIKRITPDQVKAAYEMTGLRPVQCEWLDTAAGRNCACGLSAVYAERFNIDSLEEAHGFYDDDGISETIEVGLELDRNYISGFVAGFDAGDIDNTSNLFTDIFKLGFEDGVAAWEAVKHLAIKEEPNNATTPN